MISRKYRLSSMEFKKSLRDGIVISFAVFISQLLQTVTSLDFGTYQAVADLALSMVAILVNRWMNILRISETGKIKTNLND